jgi:enoyl-CoA hydratase
MPRAALDILRQRLTPAAFVRAAFLSEVFTPDNAIEAGFLDRVVHPDELMAVAMTEAARLATLDRKAHAATKARARQVQLAALRQAMQDDATELQLL